MQRGGHHDDGKDRPRRIGKRYAADGRNRKARDQPFGFRSVDDRPARHLPEQPDDAGNREHEADLALRPFFRGQIDRDERTKAGLHVGQEEDEPVERAQAPRRGVGRLAGRDDDFRQATVGRGRGFVAIVPVPLAPMRRGHHRQPFPNAHQMAAGSRRRREPRSACPPCIRAQRQPAPWSARG